MPSARRAVAGFATVFCLVVVSQACSAPPTKEIDEAEASIESARQAGAETYAADEYRGATQARDRARQAVDQRDYRLALNHALDARERAREAARQADTGKAVARLAAEQEIKRVVAALETARGRLKVAQTARVPARDLTAARRTIASADRVVQKARTAIGQGDFASVEPALDGVFDRLQQVNTALDAAISARSSRRRRG
jgi:hypothetical protein